MARGGRRRRPGSRRAMASGAVPGGQGPGRRFRLRRRWPRVLLAAAVAVALVGAGGVAYAVSVALRFNGSIHRSDALAEASKEPGQAVPKLTRDTNILIMGMDSRLDEDGRPLPADVYAALHAGGSDVGGYNANVLMLVHVPADGSKATAISIPRDDYVETAGFPGAGYKAKVKEAYGLAFAQAMTTMLDEGRPNDDATYQQARDAGRRAEIATVTKFLGSVHIDHFIEVTMAAFYQTAQAVQPITVCVNRATQDTYSGADFKAGLQQIDAKQAIAFVRQRRDTSDPTYSFSDLDRERRQQSFIVSVMHKLKQAGTFTNLPEMQHLLDDVGKDIAVDSGLDPIQLVQEASSLTGGNISFTTLPITGFGWSPQGESINNVDVAQVQATVSSLLAPHPSPTAAPVPTGGPAAPGTHAPAAAPTPAQTAAPASSPTPTPSSTYADWTGALQGGGIPCVK